MVSFDSIYDEENADMRNRFVKYFLEGHSAEEIARLLRVDVEELTGSFLYQVFQHTYGATIFRKKHLTNM